MKYKVLQKFITKTSVYTPGDVYSVDSPGKFTNRLIKYGFVEKTVDEDKFARWEKEGIVSKLANIIIAPEDYVEGDKKHFTYDEAIELEKGLPNGWRLPTRFEMVLIAEEFGRNIQTDVLDPKLLEKNLGFQKNGKTDTDRECWYTGSSGYYWSRTDTSTTNAYYLYFNSSDLYPASTNYKYDGYSVRCVKEIK